MNGVNKDFSIITSHMNLLSNYATIGNVCKDVYLFSKLRHKLFTSSLLPVKEMDSLNLATLRNQS